MIQICFLLAIVIACRVFFYLADMDNVVYYLFLCHISEFLVAKYLQIFHLHDLVIFTCIIVPGYMLYQKIPVLDYDEHIYLGHLLGILFVEGFDNLFIILT